MTIHSISPLQAALFAALVWGGISVVVVGLYQLPALEILSISLSLSFICTILYLCVTQKWSTINASPLMWVIGTLAVGGTSFFYISATKLAPPVHVELIMYIWPLFVFVGNVLFFGERMYLHSIAALLLCLFALGMLHHDAGQWSIGTHYITGYSMVFVSACIWSVYNLYTKTQEQVSSIMIGLYAGVAAVIVIPLHYLLETHVDIAPKYWLSLCVLGIFSQCLAFTAWDYALKKVPAIFMTVISYSKPVLSVMFLILAGYGYYSYWVLLALVSILLAAILITSRQ